MKIGDVVIMSPKNRNHLDNAVCAYAGMKGVVTDIYHDGAFALKCDGCILVVPMNDAWKNPLSGVWIWLNGKHIFHRRMEDYKPRPKTWIGGLIKKMKHG